MNELQQVFDTFLSLHQDRRTELIKVKILSAEEGCITLGGTILDCCTLDKLTGSIIERMPGIKVETGQVVVLRKTPARWLSVAVNLTSVHDEPSWLAEMLSQVYYGTRLEILQQEGDWVFVRQEDGYLGWVYLPYLSEDSLPDATHMVIAPFALVHENPETGSPLTTRLAAGTQFRVDKMQQDWVSLPLLKKEKPGQRIGGWLPASSVVSLAELPSDTSSRRRIIIESAFTFFGVPYLWGGCSAGGMDCSGLSRLVHRLAGIEIPRDADMQKPAGKPVERPFKPGDLIFFTGENDSTHSHITHVAISLGGDRVIHSSRMNNGVYTNTMSEVPHLRNDFAGAVTYLSD